MPACPPGPAPATSMQARSASRSSIPGTIRLSAVSRRADRGGHRALPRYRCTPRHPAASGCSPIPTSRPRARRIRASSSPGASCTASGLGHWVPPEPVAEPVLCSAGRAGRRSPISRRSSAATATTLAMKPNSARRPRRPCAHFNGISARGRSMGSPIASTIRDARQADCRPAGLTLTRMGSDAYLHGVSWPDGRSGKDRKAAGEESPGSMETRCRVTPGGGDPRESATESKPPGRREPAG